MLYDLLYDNRGEEHHINTNEIKAEMVRKGYTQKDVAELLGISLRALSNKLNGKNKKGSFTDREIERLQEILDIDIFLK